MSAVTCDAHGALSVNVSCLGWPCQCMLAKGVVYKARTHGLVVGWWMKLGSSLQLIVVPCECTHYDM